IRIESRPNRNDPTLTSRAAELGYTAVAVTDVHNLFAGVRFCRVAQQDGVKPILGADLWLLPEGLEEPPERLTVLVENEVGHRNLCCLISRGRTWRGKAAVQ